ncbi:UNC-50 [Dillenia turbinata]|uniref:UNC-50 n=1 Tax=Dillenia turbinata TaxID=194707 RepID=A0AAN8URY0_9MAGN
MLPTTVPKGRSPSNVRPNSGLSHYLRRIIKNALDSSGGGCVKEIKSGWGGLSKHALEKMECLVRDINLIEQANFVSGIDVECQWQQMDIEYTFWQMLHLCTSPKVVYQHTKYHKQTKNQWARDDPAFVVISSLLLIVATLAHCAAEHICADSSSMVLSSTRYDHTTAHAVFVVISVLLFHFLLTGVAVASCCWLYAFDVHCNSFFPMFVMLYVIHYFISPLLVAHGFIPLLLSNLLFMVAVSYYHYLNFLGYDVLPFLEKTTFFLYPIGVVIILSPILILSGFNPSRYVMNIYFSQLL